MTGYLVLRDSPYMATTDEEGRFEIDKLPVGKHTFRVWHERFGVLQNLAFGDHLTDDAGRFSIQIESGLNLLQSAEIEASEFESSTENDLEPQTVEPGAADLESQ